MSAVVLQSVPNVSEGRSAEVVDAIGQAYVSAGVRLAATHRDVDHHRSVHVLFGSAETLVDALVAGISVAAASIDLSEQDGVHPRIGAADVVPLIGLDPAGVIEARRAALVLGERVAGEPGSRCFSMATSAQSGDPRSSGEESPWSSSDASTRVSSAPTSALSGSIRAPGPCSIPRACSAHRFQPVAR